MVHFTDKHTVVFLLAQKKYEEELIFETPYIASMDITVWFMAKISSSCYQVEVQMSSRLIGLLEVGTSISELF